jgi:hypothetical protein
MRCVFISELVIFREYCAPSASANRVRKTKLPFAIEQLHDINNKNIKLVEFLMLAERADDY